MADPRESPVATVEWLLRRHLGVSPLQIDYESLGAMRAHCDQLEAEGETDDVGFESGPFCRHWSEAGYCGEICAACGHRCSSHVEGCSEDGCGCSAWVERPA